MAITSASTQAEIVGQYLDNLSYDINGSATECGLFIAACRALLVMHPSDWQHSQERISFQPALWEKQLNLAMQKYGELSNSATGGNQVTHMDVQDFRC